MLSAHVTTPVLQPAESVLQQGARGSRDRGRKWLLCLLERRLAEGQAGFCCGPDFLQSPLSVHSMFEWLYREIAFIVSTQKNQKQKHLQHSVWRQCSQKHWGNDLPTRINVPTMQSLFSAVLNEILLWMSIPRCSFKRRKLPPCGVLLPWHVLLDSQREKCCGSKCYSPEMKTN